MRKYILMILGIAAFFYGILVLQIGSGTAFGLIWEAIGLFFFLWAFLIHKDFFTVHKKIKKIFHVSVAMGAVTLAVLCGMVISAFRAKGREDLDYIVVLGAQVREDGPSAVLRYRLDTAVVYLKENPDTICIVSGGQGANEPWSEAEGMAGYLLEKGIEKERILLEDQSKNTAQNIRFSQALMDDSYESVGIITNNFHLFRAVQLAKTQGMKGVCGIAADSTLLYLPNNVLRECCAILKDWLMRNIS